MDLSLLSDNKKKKLTAMYKEREIVGGVYVIKNTLNNKLLVEGATDLNSSRNRFEFAQKTGSCVYVKLQDDWAKQEHGQFVFEVLEEIKKGENQTNAGFKEDIELLRDMWLEKLSDENLY